MLVTPTLLHVKTHVGRSRQEPAARLVFQGLPAEGAVAGLSAGEILSRLDIPVMPRGPEATEWQCIRSDHAAMAEAGEWDDLLEALRFADQDLQMASGGRRVAPLISEGVRARLTAALAIGDLDEAEAELRRLEAVQALNAGDYCAAHLLAEAHLALAEAKPALGASESDLLAHVLAAEGILADFDPIEELSPLLAASRFRLLPFLAGAEALTRDWYEDWRDLDPEDALAHAAVAAFLVQSPGVSTAAVEKAARRAMTLTGQVTGKAAYAVFQMSARNRLGTLLPGTDLDLLVQGLADFAAASGCQHRANVAASFLADLVGTVPADGSTAALALAKLRAALADMLLTRLQEIHLESWTPGAEGLALALGEVFGPALLRGARIQRAGSGLGARIPRSASPLAANP